jgi:hypothetical protein
MGPKKLLRNKGISASTAAAAVSVIGTEASHRCADRPPRNGCGRRDVLLDLVHQDHRVSHDDAEHRDGPEHRHEAEGLVKQQQREHHADQPEGAVSTTMSTRLKLCS